MMIRKHEVQKQCLKYPQHVVSPEDLLNFIELEEFSKDWFELGLDDDDLLKIQTLIMVDPSMGSEIDGTNGLRKGTFFREAAGERLDPRESLNCLYVYFDDYKLVLLVAAYDHLDDDTFDEDQKAEIRNLIAREDRTLSEQHRK